MKKFFVMVISLITAISFCNNVFLFRNKVLFWREIENSVYLDDKVDILYVDSIEWSVRGKSDLYSALKNSTLRKIPGINGGKVINMSPLVVQLSDDRYAIYMQDGNWYAFQWKRGRILTVKGKSRALLACLGSWKAVYSLRDFKELKLYAKLWSNCEIGGNVYLVDGNTYENSKELKEAIVYTKPTKPPQFLPSTIFEKVVYGVGNVSSLSSSPTVFLHSFNIKQIERTYEFNFYTTRSESSFVSSIYTIYIKNMKENGLGLTLPDGDVYIFKSEKGTLFPLGKFTLHGSQPGDYIKIVQSFSKDVVGRVLVLENKRTGGKYYGKLKIIIKNYKEHEVNIAIKLAGYNIKVKSSTIKPSEVTINYALFKGIAQPGLNEYIVELEGGY